MVGTTINHYKILEKIGQGGMGEVYRAEDTKLKREVAIKVLPEQFTQDPQRLARFEREAKLLASLNHPNIAAIHSFEQPRPDRPKQTKERRCWSRRRELRAEPTWPSWIW